MISESEYISVAEAINKCRDCNFVDIATSVAETLETFNPSLRREFYSKAILKGTEWEKTEE